MKHVVTTIAIACCAVACGASAPPPTDRLAQSEAAIRSARELGAQQDPQAQLHLKLADEQVAAARGLMRDGENKRADMILQRAKSDAELAVVITRERAAKTEAEQASQKLNSQKAGQTPVIH